MKSFCTSFVLVVTVWASESTVAAQVVAPPPPQPAPPVTAPAPAGASRPGATAANLGPIIATSDTAAYVSTEATGRAVVFMGSDASPYGIVGTYSNHPLGFRTNNIARMFIDTNGNVGIGTPGPGYRLDVSGDTNITGTYRVNGVPISATVNWTQAGNNIYYATGNVGIGTTGPQSRLHINGVPEGVRIQGPDAGTANTAFATFVDSAGIRIGYVGDGSTGDKSVFLDSDEGDVVLNTAAGRVLTATSTGNVAIGTTNPTFAKLHVEGGDSSGVAGYSTSNYAVSGSSSDGIGVKGFSDSGIAVYGSSNSGYAGRFVGPVSVNGVVCATNVSCSSDARLKQNIAPLSYGLREVLRLRPVRWQWKDTTTTQLNLGLVAQDVEPVLPELILRNVDTHGSLGLNYFGFVPVMIRAIQEQQDTIAALDARIRTLEQTLRDVLRSPQSAASSVNTLDR